MARLFLNIKTSATDPSKYSIFSIRVTVSNNELATYQSFYDELLFIPNSIEINGIGHKR